MPNYTALATVKEYLGIPTATASEDTAITAAIDAAEAQIDKYTGRTFITGAGTSAKTFTPTTDRELRVPDIGTLTGLAVKEDTSDNGTFDTTLTITTHFFLPGNEAPYGLIVRAGTSWPRPTSGRPSVEVTASWSYDESATPSDIVQAATLQAARLYQRRSAPLGMVSGMSSEFGPVRISRFDPDVRELLAGYRLIGVA